jgi:hypothetical protein
MISTTKTTSGISETQALCLEEIESRAWMDMYAAAPPDFARMLRIKSHENANMVLVSAALPAGLFNKTFLHGLTMPLDALQISEIKHFFAGNEAAVYQVYLTPFSKPCFAEQLLHEHGLRKTSATDKVICDPQGIRINPQTAADGILIQEVTKDNGEEWASFICATYNGLPNHPWLEALVNRKGWHHLVAVRDGRVIACRSMYINEQNAWLGIDAPIPGLMTNDFIPDKLITQQLLKTAGELGVTLVNSCIEAVDASRQTAAYTYLYELGFSVAYTRNLYSPAS